MVLAGSDCAKATQREKQSRALMGEREVTAGNGRENIERQWRKEEGMVERHDELDKSLFSVLYVLGALRKRYPLGISIFMISEMEPVMISSLLTSLQYNELHKNVKA